MTVLSEQANIFRKYKKALVYIGVDFSRPEIVALIEDCDRDLEPKLQAVVAYWYWLRKQNRQIIDPNQLIVEAFFEQWQPIGWQDEFLENKNFKTAGEKWWLEAKQVDVIKDIVVDIQEDFWSGGKVYFRHPLDGSSFPLSLDRVLDLDWQELISTYERSTKVKIEFTPSRLIFQRQAN
ncbi:MAG: hypothetical protein AAFO85_05485 [Cyanobacteria bacterium J06598_4]